ncbi:MAG: metal-sensitive transcriptional regulator [Armatimonadota bacterium]|nr:metal-sensitive transcriptional regulator [Armatimonadota bacterium]
MAQDTQADVISRLRKIEGQVRGLQRMIEENKDCAEVVNQLAAARQALDRVGFLILTHRLEECVRKRMENGVDADAAMNEAMKLFLILA